MVTVMKITTTQKSSGQVTAMAPKENNPPAAIP